LGSSTDSAHLGAAKGLPYAFASHFASAQLHPALEIYRKEFQPSEVLDKPYTIAGVNIIVADTDEEAERSFTSLIRMFFGVLTENSKSLQPPTEMTEDLIEVLKYPSLHQMLKYSFVGSKETVKKQIEDFLKKTQVDEIIMVSNIFALEDRIKSAQLFAELMDEINAESSSDSINQ